jgi:lysophospholipase L1-like esterase
MGFTLLCVMKKIYSIALILSLLLNVATTLYALKLRHYIQSDVAEKQSRALDVMTAKTRNYDSLAVDSSDVIFFGNSITEGFPVNDFFHNPKIKNRGIGGNTTLDLRSRLNQALSAKRVFIMIGINDFRDGKSPQEVFDNFKFIADSLKSKLIVQSVLPTWGQHKNLLPAIKEYNRLLKNYCDENDLTFLDLFTPFSKKDYTYDGLHLKFDGYKLWAGLIKKYCSNDLEQNPPVETRGR